MNKMKKKSGFTLIEVLIAMLVLSLGLLGLAGIQARSLKNNVSAYNRAQATQLAYDMADRIRANVVETKKSSKSNPATSAYEIATTASATLNKFAACNSAPGCTAAQLVQNDLSEWNGAIKRTFPGVKADGQITFKEKTLVIKTGVSPDPDSKIKVGIMTISVSWDDNRDGEIDKGQGGNRVDCDSDSDSVKYCDPSFQMSFQLWSVEA